MTAAPTLADAPQLTSADIELWLRSRGIMQAWAGLHIARKMPTPATLAEGKDRALIITRSGGLPKSTELHLSKTIYVMRCIGRQRDADDAEAFALWIDRLLLGSGTMLAYGSKRVLSVAPAGGDPVPIMEDAAYRTHYTCGYVFTAGSSI